MSNTIKISLDTSQYRLPTQEDITSGKQFILRREEYARVLEAKVDDCLANAAQEIVTICYKYNVDPQKFSINSQYNEKMMAEIAEVMDNLEEEILDLIYDYSTATVSDGSPSGRKEALAAWIALLGRGNRNLQGTLDGYLYKTMKDWETAIAALRYANVAMAAAVTKVKSHLHSIYTMPEVRATFDHAEDFNATYIRNKGIQKGAVGISNNGSTNVTNMAKLTLQMAWMKELSMEHEDDGAAGYYVLRGSSYPCETCDSMVGFHKMEDIDGYPPYHGHCCCYVIPIFPAETKVEETTSSTQDRREEYERYQQDPDYTDVEYNPQNGGLKATHLDHNFDKKTGNSEKVVQQIGFEQGHSVILERERHDLQNVKNTEGSWDDMKMEIASATTGSHNNLVHAISHCASKPDVEVAVVHIPIGTPIGKMESAVRGFAGLEKSNPQQWHKFTEIIFIIEESRKIKAYHQ